MSSRPNPRRSVVADGMYRVLNPIPFGCFVAAMLFDIIYAQSAEIFWDKGAAWLIVFGLLFAVLPRLINLTRVWLTFRRSATRADRLDFWLNLAAIILAIVNAFVHSRDAYASVPSGPWLSVGTVILLSAGTIAVATERATHVGYVNE